MVVVVISGKPVSGSSTLARKLAEMLGLRYFSAGEVYKAIATSNVPGHLTEAVNAFLKSEKGSSRELHERIDRMQAEFAKQGNAIVEGKLAIHFAGDHADLKVWVEAEDSERARRLAEREGYGMEKAMEVLKERDSVDRKQFMKIYGFDPWQQREDADIILDSTSAGPDELAVEIISELRRRGVFDG